jgi:hypothetical protein
LRPDIVLAERISKFITAEAEKPPPGKEEKPGYVYSVDTDGGCTPKKLSYDALAALQTPTTPPPNQDGSNGSIGTNPSPAMPVAGETQLLNPAYVTDDQWEDMSIIVCGLIRKRIPPSWHHIISNVDRGDVQEMLKAVYGKAYSDPKRHFAASSRSPCDRTGIGRPHV